MADAALPVTCHVCKLPRKGQFCLNCGQWVCSKHYGGESYWQPGRWLCEPCAALPPWDRKRIKTDKSGYHRERRSRVAAARRKGEDAS